MPDEQVWYYAKGGQHVGPMTMDELARQLPAAGGEKAHVYGPGLGNWTEARNVPAVAQALRDADRPAPPPYRPPPEMPPPPGPRHPHDAPAYGAPVYGASAPAPGAPAYGTRAYGATPFGAAPPPPRPGPAYGQSPAQGSPYGQPPSPSQPRPRADEIDYHVAGEEMQYVELTLDPGEMVIGEPGGMMYMTPGIHMETVFGDPSAAGGQQGGLLGKFMTAGKRLLTGESLFMTTYLNNAAGREVVAFAAPFPGKIIPMDLRQLGGELVCQKDSFLCAARGVQIGIAFQRKLGVGLFGGEGFIMQRLTGDGLAFVHAGGTILKRTLSHGESLRVDTGCLVALQPTVQYDVQFVKGVKNALFGGEGLFFAALTGPGDVWLQSLPFSRLAGRIIAASAGGKGEGSVLGGLGRMFDGDNA